jgi:hypothetical protein
MNFSAGNRLRKWPCGRGAPAVTAGVVAVVLGLVGPAGPASAARRLPRDGPGDLFTQDRSKPRGSEVSEKVPLPRPRPAEAPGAAAAAPSGDKAAPAEAERPAAPAASAVPAAPQPSACRLGLTEEVAIAPSVPDIHGPGGCGGDDLVRLEAVVLPDKRRVSVTPAAILRCGMAAAIADWIRTDVAPLAAGLGSSLIGLENYESYECRSFNHIAGAHLSEHGHANALDVRAFKLADGRSIALTDRTVPRDLRENVLHSVCARFSTVLGPGSDWYHEEHIHLDLMERRNNYKICQWNVWEPLPQIAPLLPAERPEEAPPRQLAAGPDAAKSETKPETKSETKPERAPEIKPESSAPDAAAPDNHLVPLPTPRPSTIEPSTIEPSTIEPSTVEPSKTRPATTKPATKKRRQYRRSLFDLFPRSG